MRRFLISLFTLHLRKAGMDMLRYVQRSLARCDFPRPEGMSPVLHRLLMQRGVASVEEAQAFLHPGRDQLHDPMLLSDMHEAVERIRAAIDGEQRICVYGDYDVDGVCASAILSGYLREVGAEVEVYLPSRHSEGYGLNEGAIREIAARAELLVTVDCGVASCELIELAKSLGLTCIVTDHHRPGEILPDCPVVNPLRNDYPFPWLCGAGVAFKLVHALGGEEAAMARIDLAAIATVADVVSLTGENRAIVHLGLKRINAGHVRPGLAALMESARIEPGTLTSEGIAFRIAPRLNAGGRLGSARRSFELLTQEDPFLAVAQADELEQENARRQSVEREIRAAAEEQLRDFDFSAHRILMVRGAGWNPGVIGLTASRLREEYNFPTIVFAENDGVLTGSCRSIEGVDIYETLSSAAELLERYGGHRQAAGLTLRAENFDALQAALDEYLFRNAPAEAYLPMAEYDIDVSLNECSEAFVREMQALEPTGCGNPEPVFRTAVQLIEARAIGAQGAHLRLVASEHGVRRTGVFFGAGNWVNRLGDAAEILFTPQLNVWNGRTDVQLRLCALRESDVHAQIAANRDSEGEKQRRFLTELLYNRGYHRTDCPQHTDVDALRALLHRGVQGTWILCASLDSAQQLRAALADCPLDLSIGALPEDARAFNAIAVCPERLDGFPRALRRLVLAGLPAPEGVIPGVELLSLDWEEPLWRELPDVDQMREVYRAALHLSRRPLHLSGWEALDSRLGEEAQLPMTACHASLLALMDMQLIEVREKPFAMQVPPVRKTDPQSSALWRAIEALKKTTKGGCAHDR